MFSSVPDRGHESGRVSVPVLVPWAFVWRYGGRSVSLCGSFTRWSGSIPMSPVEGRNDMFQVVCNLTPGHHQFKFCVDGVWQHDESQPFIKGDYGLVNTVFVPREPDLITSPFSSQTPGRSNMDVDCDIIIPVVALSHGTLQEAIPRISSAELEVSRHRISLFLSTHTAYELLPESGKIITLDVNLPVKQAFHILYEQMYIFADIRYFQGISVAPLWDFCNGQYVGVLSALDFILILRELGTHGSNLTEEELETHTIAAWKEGKLHLTRTMDGNGGPLPRRCLVNAGPYDCMKDVALKILQNKVATVPIIHSSQDGTFPQLLHLASLSGILKCIYRYFRHSLSSLPILQQPICAIPLGTWVPKIGESKQFVMLRPNASLSSALA
ncbi:Sucrose nonfermenting 4-like protein [Morella rubra]|uniref:Sucrose nonfermenting 4-like protein n=1 Tax=Morella rubra TaxID=262757 RepID=A0A6A1UM45_9ROSI|nr:Sucrose nonfermenting 4-like protein [Morella rubra]